METSSDIGTCWIWRNDAITSTPCGESGRHQIWRQISFCRLLSVGPCSFDTLRSRALVNDLSNDRIYTCGSSGVPHRNDVGIHSFLFILGLRMDDVLDLLNPCTPSLVA